MASSNNSKNNYSNIEFYIDRDNPMANDLSNCVLITGFFGIGKIGFIVVNHMINKLKAERIGYIVTDNIPPFLSVQNQSLVLPFVIYRAGNIVFIATYFEPYKNEHRAFAKAVVQWSVQENFKEMILVGGLDSRLRTEDSVLAKAILTTKYKKDNAKLNVVMMEEGLYVTGPLALLLIYCEVYDFPAIGILAYAERSRPDPIGASNAVNIISDIIRINCGVEELVKQAENIEKEMSAHLDAIERSKKDSKDENESDGGLFF